jgi:hypothetical protein
MKILTKHHVTKKYWESEGVAPRILNVGTRWREVSGQLHTQAFNYFSGISLSVSIRHKTVSVRVLQSTYTKMNNSLHLPTLHKSRKTEYSKVIRVLWCTVPYFRITVGHRCLEDLDYVINARLLPV